MTRKSTAERKQEIVQAVLALISKLGIHGVTMGRIADKVGITEAALYRHFDSKLGIIGATIDAAFDDLLAPVLRATGFDTPNPPPRLEHYWLPDADRVLDLVHHTLEFD